MIDGHQGQDRVISRKNSNKATPGRPTHELPHDLLSEKSLLSCLILDGSAYDSITDVHLNKEDFYHPQYATLFEAISDLYLSNRPVDYVTVCSRLREMGRLESMGGEDFILEIGEDQVSSANVYHYAKIVKEKATLREIIRTSYLVAEKGVSFSGKTEDFIQEVEQSFFKLTLQAKSGGINKINVALRKNLKDLEEGERKKGELSGLTTSYGRLDELLLGLQPGQLVVLAARPGMGKTSLGLNMAVRSCKATKLPVVIFSLEMLEHELSLRMISSEGKVELRRLKSKELQDTDLRNIAKVYQELSNLPIYINDAGNTTVVDILARCRKIKAESGLGMIMVDYLQLLRPHTGTDSREQQIAEMSRSLKSMAKELGCPVLALSQLNRGVEHRPDKRPSTADLRESGSIEQDADIVMMIYRDDYYNKDSKEPGVAEVIVCKNRSGETGVAKLAWVGGYTSFENLINRE